ERGLRRAVAAPARVSLDGRVRADVDNRAARFGERFCQELDQRERRDHVGLEYRPQVTEWVVGKLRQRADAERARVVDEQVESSTLAAARGGRLGELASVVGVGDVA